MKIFIGADHGGYALKEHFKAWLETLGHEVVDCGNTQFDPVDDFPDFAFAVADRVSQDPTSRGILLCRSGGGMVIAANKVSGVRAVIGVNVDDVTHNRADDDANILGLAADFISEEEARSLVTSFIATPFRGEERFIRRLKKIAERERK